MQQCLKEVFFKPDIHPAHVWFPEIAFAQEVSLCMCPRLLKPFT